MPKEIIIVQPVSRFLSIFKPNIFVSLKIFRIRCSDSIPQTHDSTRTYSEKTLGINQRQRKCCRIITKIKFIKRFSDVATLLLISYHNFDNQLIVNNIVNIYTDEGL